jgi:hypothetical protein
MGHCFQWIMISLVGMEDILHLLKFLISMSHVKLIAYGLVEDIIREILPPPHISPKSRGGGGGGGEEYCE